MFGENLEKFIEENIEFKCQGTRPNQDIYWNIVDKKFRVHKYFGNESLSADEEEQVILIHKVKNYEEFDNVCSCCNGDSNNNVGLDCSLWQECQAEDLYEHIMENRDEDYGISYRVKEKLLDNVHCSELQELELLIIREFGETYEYLQKLNNQTDYSDGIAEDIILNGYNDLENINDGYLDEDCIHLYYKYCEYADNELLVLIGELLMEHKIMEALRIMKECFAE